MLSFTHSLQSAGVVAVASTSWIHIALDLLPVLTDKHWAEPSDTAVASVTLLPTLCTQAEKGI